MMLVTFAWSPPTWVAMLPQKFSAATTSTFELLPAAGTLDKPQAPAVRTTATASDARPAGPIKWPTSNPRLGPNPCSPPMNPNDRRCARVLHKSHAQDECVIVGMIWAMPRPSPVTDEVKRLLLSGGRHAWSLEELLDGVRGSLGGADYSSGFRATVALEQARAIARPELGDGTAH